MKEPTRQEWLAVPLDVLRAHFADRAERSSVRAAAEAAGVGRTTLHAFLAGESQPQPRIRRLLALAYLRDRAEPAGEGLDAAFSILSGYLPEEDRERTRERLADVLADEFRKAGMRPPKWLKRL
jgi:hypothetical protein